MTKFNPIPKVKYEYSLDWDELCLRYRGISDPRFKVQEQFTSSEDQIWYVNQMLCDVESLREFLLKEVQIYDNFYDDLFPIE